MVKVEMAVDEENLEIFVCVSGIEVVPNGGCPRVLFAWVEGRNEGRNEGQGGDYCSRC
jgi:hypothetical protein